VISVHKDVIDRLWAQIEPDVYITREQFVRGLVDWDIEAIRIDGELAFVTLTRGPEFHYTSFGVGKISIAMIRLWLAPILDLHGYATTRTLKSEPRQHRLNLRLGCTVTGEDEFTIHYRLDRPQHGLELECP
jgi:hypothetical protein